MPVDVTTLPDPPASQQKTFSPQNSSFALREEYQKQHKANRNEEKDKAEEDVEQKDNTKDVAASAQDGGASQQQHQNDTGLQPKVETKEAWDRNLRRTILDFSMVFEKRHLEFNNLCFKEDYISSINAHKIK